MTQFSTVFQRWRMAATVALCDAFGEASNLITTGRPAPSAGNGFSIQPCGLRCVASKHFTHRARSGSTRRSAPHQRQRLTSSLRHTAAQSRSSSTGGVRTADSQTQHEQFELGAFDASLERGGQELRVNHSRPALRGSFMRLAVDARELRFRFDLQAGTTGTRQVLDGIKSGAIRACSIGFKPEGFNYHGSTLAYSRAHLTENFDSGRSHT